MSMHRTGTDQAESHAECMPRKDREVAVVAAVVEGGWEAGEAGRAVPHTAGKEDKQAPSRWLAR